MSFTVNINFEVFACFFQNFSSSNILEDPLYSTDSEFILKL